MLIVQSTNAPLSLAGFEIVLIPFLKVYIALTALFTQTPVGSVLQRTRPNAICIPNRTIGVNLRKSYALNPSGPVGSVS